MEIFKIDGSFGEGGGQIVRTAVTLACILGKPIQIDNIRSKRKIPGLRAQHVTAIRIIGQICDAKIKGLEIGSTSISFVPNKVKSCTITDEVGTAGSISLILQVLVPAVAISKNSLDLSIIGGTDVKWSPTINYTKFVLSEAYSRMGIKFSLNVKKRGYFPRGGGLVELKVFPSTKISPIKLSKSQTKKVKLFCSYSKITPGKIDSEIRIIKDQLEIKGYSIEKKIVEESAQNQGGSILLFSIDKDAIIGIDGLIENKNNKFPSFLSDKFLQCTQSVDENLADMLVLPACLADGMSIFTVKKITKHLETNLFVASEISGCKYGIGKLTDGFEVRIEGSNPGV